MAIQKEKLFMLQYVDYRAPKRYISSYAEHDWEHTLGSCILIGEMEIDVDYPDVDTRQVQISALEVKLEKVRAESQATIDSILDRISNLKAVGHEVAQ